MGSYNTTIMPNKEPETQLSKEFDRQVANLIRKAWNWQSTSRAASVA